MMLSCCALYALCYNGRGSQSLRVRANLKNASSVQIVGYKPVTCMHEVKITSNCWSPQREQCQLSRQTLNARYDIKITWVKD
jgi:hypothetical protein